MGKKLRSRELLTETDHQNDDNQQQAYPITHHIGSSTIRKNIKDRFFIKRDLMNQKAHSFRSRIFNCQFSQIISSSRFECPICLEIMVNPVLMVCGHAFCLRCLQSNAAHSQKCCLCRSENKGDPYIPIKIAENIIEKFLVPFGPELVRYLCRTTDSAEWSKRRNIANWKLGLVVDFQDRFHIWRRGVIVNILNDGQVQIKTNFNGIDLLQKVQKTSRRLAQYTFFTRSRYLEDFPTALPEHDPTQNQFSNIQYRFNREEDNTFHFPEQHSEEVQVEAYESLEDQAIRIFNLQMGEMDSIFNF